MDFITRQKLKIAASFSSTGQAGSDYLRKGLENDIEKSKGPHKNHKYLRIENGKYIYDESKMNASNHKEAGLHHSNQKTTLKEQGKHVDADYHAELEDKHNKLAEEKEKTEASSSKKYTGTIGKVVTSILKEDEKFDSNFKTFNNSGLKQHKILVGGINLKDNSEKGYYRPEKSDELIPLANHLLKRLKEHFPDKNPSVGIVWKYGYGFEIRVDRDHNN